MKYEHSKKKKNETDHEQDDEPHIKKSSKIIKYALIILF